MTDEKKHERDAEQVKEILTVVSEKIPALLNSLADVLYGKDQSVKYGQAVAGFYKTLKDSGMTDDQAYELTKQYMSAMNLGGMIGSALRGGGRGAGMAVKLRKDEQGGEHHDDEPDDDEDEE